MHMRVLQSTGDEKSIHNISMKRILLLLVVVGVSQCAPRQDLVRFPLYDSKNAFYSGYLNFTKGQFHYVYFDSMSEPRKDPLVLWLNGGPGCSSLIGMAYENGPFVFRPNTTAWQLNNHTWNQHANILYIQSPGGVGFSKGFRNNVNTDASVSTDNYMALVAFFAKFSQLLDNDFYIAGQSYAGIYIPYLAREILTRNGLPNRDITIKLKGFLVGNACTDPRECFEPSQNKSIDGMSIYQYQYLHEHSYISDKRYTEISGICTFAYESQPCKDARNKTNIDFDNTKTQINNIYAPCYYQKLPYMGHTPQRGLQTRRKHQVTDSGEVCDDLIGIQTFFNQPSATAEFHVDFIPFQFCSDAVADNYVMDELATEHMYPALIKAGLRIWVYSGDIDANVPITGTLRWVSRMRENEGIPIEEPWREWWVPQEHVHQDQMGGMVWTLKGFTFVSVKGAGHMVPRDKPKEAYVMFNAFINGQKLPYKTV